MFIYGIKDDLNLTLSNFRTHTFQYTSPSSLLSYKMAFHFLGGVLPVTKCSLSPARASPRPPLLSTTDPSCLPKAGPQPPSSLTVSAGLVPPRLAGCDDISLLGHTPSLGPVLKGCSPDVTGHLEHPAVSDSSSTPSLCFSPGRTAPSGLSGLCPCTCPRGHACLISANPPRSTREAFTGHTEAPATSLHALLVSIVLCYSCPFGPKAPSVASTTDVYLLK